MTQEHCVLIALVVFDGLTNVVQEVAGWHQTGRAVTQVDRVVLKAKLGEFHPDGELVARFTGAKGALSCCSIHSAVCVVMS